MRVTIELPDDVVAYQDSDELRQNIRLSYALRLYQGGNVTISKAAKLAGVDIYEFMAACKQSGIPTIDVDRNELIAEMEG